MKNILLSALTIILLFSCGKKEETKTETTVVKDTTVVEENTLTIPDSTTISNAWNDYMTPGEPHKMLILDSGTWNEEMTMWMKPGAEPTKNTMTAESKMIYGDRFQETTHKGDFMGMPFEGKSTLAYNNASQEYTSTWIDNMSTGIMVITGKYDEATKTINFSGTTVDPVTKKEKPIRETYTFVDENTRKMEMFDVDYSGKEYKSMEIIMTRKK
ncbi:DUF1579 domain-containing protein [Flavobacterium azooxidireducens]|uniref:DUF1579 domain-containing protein n=1 Tax=Flavobacterium azooxidireducens TaxID=1871076 RepID=A0ABY4KFB8_9FLAO|nr:DUF1579 domain-containing protein [Flavobacterium azooxidireducens]UPQ78463.1 DUF1579 domain-containing protein [Flavobacterium azooxidireducens]